MSGELTRRVSYDSPGGGKDEFFLPPLSQGIYDLIEYCGAAFKQQTANNPIVLDVGCGEQPLRSRLSGAFKYYSLDLPSNTKCVPDFEGAIDGSLPCTLFTVAPFDLLVCTEVLEHVLNWEVAWRNLSLLSKEGGYLLVTVPFLYRLHEEPHDYWRPTRYALESIALTHGFQVVKRIEIGEGRDVLGSVLANVDVACLAARPFSWRTTLFVRWWIKILMRMCRGSALRGRAEIRTPGLCLNTAFLFRNVCAGRTEGTQINGA